METIEKYDRLRLIYMTRFLLFFLIWFALNSFTHDYKVENEFLKIFMVIIQLTALVISVPNLIKYIKLFRIIKRDKRLFEALNNELYQHYKLKSARVAYITFGICIVSFLSILDYVTIPAIIVCQILFFVVLSSIFISTQIYYKQ